MLVPLLWSTGYDYFREELAFSRGTGQEMDQKVFVQNHPPSRFNIISFNNIHKYLCPFAPLIFPICGKLKILFPLLLHQLTSSFNRDIEKERELEGAMRIRGVRTPADNAAIPQDTDRLRGKHRAKSVKKFEFPKTMVQWECQRVSLFDFLFRVKVNILG